MSNNYNQLPNFFGNNMMMYNINTEDDEDVGEEISRRINFTPSIRPIIGENALSNRDEHLSTPSTKMLQQQSPISSSSSSWNLTDAPVVPSFGHPLEPTSVLVPNTTASEMANRVSHILEQELEMIQVEYNENQAECRTCDNVEFAVWLYSAEGGGIIVEVQRIYGNSFSFYAAVTKVILDGVSEQKQQISSRNTIECCNDTAANVEVPSLDFAFKMLRRLETQQLGLEILLSMTDSTGKKMVSQSLVKNEEFLTLVFEIIDRESEESRMSCLMLLWNITKFGGVIKQQQEHLVPFLASNEAQVVFLAAQCLLQSDYQNIEIGTETLRQAHQLGQKTHHSALCRSVSSLSTNISLAC